MIPIELFVCDIDGTLTDGSVYMDSQGNQMVKYSRLDGYGFELLKKKGIPTVWLTAEEFNDTHTFRAKRLNIDYFLTAKSDNKAEVLSKFLSEHSISWDKVAYIGDDMSDLPCLEKAGLPFVVGNSFLHEYINSDCDYMYGYIDITDRSGGCGCVREAVNYILGGERCETQ